MTYGCPAWSDDTLGMISGYTYDSDAGGIVYDDVESGKFQDTYIMTVSMFNLGIGGLCVDMDDKALEKTIQERYPDYQRKIYTWDELVELCKQNPDLNYRKTLYEVTKDNTVEPLPVVYRSVKDNERFTDLYTVIDSYVDQETAKFVTGQRPLSELDDFQEELKSMDIDEYLELCQSFFANYER